MTSTVRKCSIANIGFTLTAYSIGVAGGGTSVNAIPGNAWFDMRSPQPEEFVKMENRMREMAQAAVAVENKTRSTKTGEISVKINLVAIGLQAPEMRI